MQEPQARFPLWLLHSGLPEHLGAIAGNAAAWALLRAVVELDIGANPARPGIVETPLCELARRTGFKPRALRSSVTALRKAGCLRAFLPESNEEPALFEVRVPLPTPIPPQDVLRAHPEFERTALADLRYATAPEAEPAHAEKLQRVVDLYLDLFSMRMNAFILDELRLISDRCDIELVERVFQRAKKNGARSLSWILAELRREKSPPGADGTVGVG